ncbi:MAG: hypothetical protein JJU10_05615 [Idiomarina sp.]|nr:hypothetical protein [Idiomarina sp.]
MSTKVEDFLSDLEAGTFVDRVSQALSNVALGVVTNGKKGKVTIQFDLSQIGDSSQITIDHTLSYVKPTAKGKVTEVTTSKTPMHVNKGGKITWNQEDQIQMFGRNGEPNPPQQ